MECLEDAHAWRHLHDPHLLAHLDAEGVFNLAKRAGLSKEAAARVARDHAWERMRREAPG